MSQEQTKCLHPLDKTLYLTTCYTPHLMKPEGLSVAVHMFLCKVCGNTQSVFQEVPRGYLQDGTVSADMKVEMERMRADRELDRRLAQKLEEVKLKGVLDGNDQHGHASN